MAWECTTIPLNKKRRPIAEEQKKHIAPELWWKYEYTEDFVPNFAKSSVPREISHLLYSCSGDVDREILFLRERKLNYQWLGSYFKYPQGWLWKRIRHEFESRGLKDSNFLLNRAHEQGVSEEEGDLCIFNVQSGFESVRDAEQYEERPDLLYNNGFFLISFEMTAWAGLKLFRHLVKCDGRKLGAQYLKSFSCAEDVYAMAKEFFDFLQMKINKEGKNQHTSPILLQRFEDLADDNMRDLRESVKTGTLALSTETNIEDHTAEDANAYMGWNREEYVHRCYAAAAVISLINDWVSEMAFSSSLIMGWRDYLFSELLSKIENFSDMLWSESYQVMEEALRKSEKEIHALQIDDDFNVHRAYKNSGKADEEDVPF